MATFAQIKAIRLKVDDPAGYLDLQEATTYPAMPSHKTAYLIGGRYVYTDKPAGALQSDYIPCDYRLSDARIAEWIDSGVDATQQAYKAILARLGNELLIVRNQAGAESTQFVAIQDLYNYYSSLLTTESANAGRFVASIGPEVAGGNV